MKASSVAISLLVVATVIGIPAYLKHRQGSPAAQPVQATTSLPVFVDIGTTTCAPCKAMVRVMDELRQQYPGAFVIKFVNIKENPAEGKSYGIQGIPTQIFYDASGKELFRHWGVLRTQEVIAKWAELGYQFKPAAGK